VSQLMIDSRFVGVPWKTVFKDITWRQTTNYAAAIGDINPHYFDDEQPAGLVAHPMFAVTLGWPLIANIHQYIDLPYPKAVFDQQVHHTTYIDLQRLMRPGERVRIESEIAAVIPHRAGTEVYFKFTVTDDEGRLVHHEYMGVLLRDVQCTDGGGGEVPPAPREKFAAQPLWEAPVPIAPSLPYVYDGCSGIIFDIHTSPRFAHAVGLPGIVLQGTATIATAVREVVTRELDGDPHRVRLIGAKLTGMVFPGNEVAVQLRERRQGGGRRELFFEVQNVTTGQRALSYGYLAADA